MGKRGKRKVSEGVALASFGLHSSISLREEASGKKQSHNVKSMLKLNHLKNLAEWSGKASVPSLGAFFGRRFAEYGEALGITPEHSLFPCQRCETILQPGFNCSVHIEKNRAKKRRCRNRKIPPPQNYVVYSCHFCSHRNLKRGTSEGYSRERSPSKAKLRTKTECSTALKCNNPVKTNVNRVENYEAIEAPAPVMSNIPMSLTNSSTPLATTGAKLLDSRRKKRKKPLTGSVDASLVSSAPAEAGKTSSTSRKRRKSWISLKEIAAGEEQEKNQRMKNFSIPFIL